MRPGRSKNHKPQWQSIVEDEPWPTPAVSDSDDMQIYTSGSSEPPLEGPLSGGFGSSDGWTRSDAAASEENVVMSLDEGVPTATEDATTTAAALGGGGVQASTPEEHQDEQEDHDVEASHQSPLSKSTSTGASTLKYRQRRRYLLILLVLSLAAMIAGIVLAVWGTQKDKNKNASSQQEEGESTMSPTTLLAPSSAPSPSSDTGGTTLPPAAGEIPVNTTAPSSSSVPSASPTSVPTTNSPSSVPTTSPQPTSSPSSSPSTLFPTFNRVPTSSPSQAAPLFESLHSVQFGSTTTDCNYTTPPLTIQCGNGGELRWNRADSNNVEDCQFVDVNRMVCVKEQQANSDPLVSFTCRGERFTQLPATTWLDGGSAVNCNGVTSVDVFSTTYGGSARHYIQLQRYCGVDQNSLVGSGNYPCLIGQTQTTDSGGSYCYSADSCQITTPCNPPNACDNATCTTTLSSVRVSDPDTRETCRFLVES